jgi:thiol-disulfide isomerase/thioredoxin
VVSLRLPGRIRLSTTLIAAAVVLLVIAAVSVLTAGSSAPQALRLAKPFTLGQVGDPAKLVSLSGYAGQPVIINFFGSWCEVCQQETPLLARFYQAHHGQIRIIGIDGRDRTPAALKFLRAKGVSYPVVADTNLALTSAYGVGAGYPQTFFLNSRHQIVKHIVGAVTPGELDAWASSLARQAGTS